MQRLERLTYKVAENYTFMDWSTPSPRSGRRRRRNSKEKPGALPDTPPESTYPQPSRSAPPSNLATHQQGGPRGNRTRASLRPLADAWLAQYPFDKKITANDENTPYLELIPQAMNSPSLNLEGCFDSEQEAIRFFIAQDSLEFPDQELVLRVQKFCKGSHTALSLFTPPLLLSGEEGNIINASAPKVWIHDRDWSKNPQRNTRSYERVLTTKRQDQVLREKVSHPSNSCRESLT